MADIDRRKLLATVLPGAVIAAAGATAITTLGLSTAEAVPLGAGETAAPDACDATESAPTDVSAQYWRRQRRRYWRRRRRLRRRIRRCWWSGGRRRCGWVWV
jgi:hypothetical protein